jgi:hypothetical protein
VASRRIPCEKFLKWQENNLHFNQLINEKNKNIPLENSLNKKAALAAF